MIKERESYYRKYNSTVNHNSNRIKIKMDNRILVESILNTK